MAKKDKSKDETPGYQKYQYGALAGRFFNSEESREFTDGAFFVLAEDLGIEEYGKHFIEGTLESEEGTKKAARGYSKDFENAFNSQKPSIDGWYSSTLNGLSDDEKATIKNVFLEHKDKSYAQIQKEAQEAMYKTKAPEGMYSKEEISKNRKILEKYEKFIILKGKLDTYKFETLREKAVEMSRLRNLKDLTSKL